MRGNYTMKMTETDQILADRLLRLYLNQLIKVGYIDKFGKDFFFHLATATRLTTAAAAWPRTTGSTPMRASTA